MTDRTARTALYRCFDADDDLLYVGITVDPAQRWEQHRGTAWWKHVTMREIEWYDDRASAERAERKAIRSECPRHNVQHNGAVPAERVQEILARAARRANGGSAA